MGFVPLDSLEQLTANRYEAVLIAAQLARQLNAIRLAKLEMLSEENADKVDIDGRKVTFVAIRDCIDGKVRYHAGNEQ
ncbi:MAG: DNA-directed RNA polymerase subunit omega [candidate division Zixibacteria bacterium]|nr:DNA-directed RNA polymerase subunit omega [candidate division Zixibacteria bacterium]